MPFSLKRQFWVRSALTAAAVGGCMLPAGASAAGHGHHRQSPRASVGLWEGYRAPCPGCDQSWLGYGAEPCGCQSQRPRHPILGLLDSVAGGVEHVLGLSGPRSAACDQAGCDDACDAMTLQYLQGPSPLTHHSESPAPPGVRAGQPPRPLPFVPGATPGQVIERVPAPQSQPEPSDPFADEQADNRPINPAISPSAYFE